MSIETCKRLIASAVFVAAALQPAWGSITNIAGYAAVDLTEIRFGETGDSDQASDSYPDTVATLPLQVIAQLVSGTSGEEAAAVAAAQFADPTSLDQANPEEFAIQLALNSISANTRYEGTALAREIRTVVFAPGELGANLQEGDTASLTGRLFIDGALTIIAIDADRDLTDSSALLRVTVKKQVEGLDAQTVFSGAVSLRGGVGGTADVTAEGAFPTNRLLRSGLAALVSEYGVFQVLVIPNIAIDYDYTAVIGETFTLEATVEVEAQNIADGAGVVAVIGTPVDSLAQVLEATQGESVAQKTIAALTTERESPTGELAFPDTQIPTLFPLCGILGFESLFGFVALFAFKLRRA